MRRALVLLPALVAGLLSGCETTCIPTQTQAQEANKVDLVAPNGSSVLRARLTAEGEGLSGRTLRFDVLADGDSVYSDTSATGGDGAAGLDLKRVDAGALGGIVRGDAFRASFAGDATYCASSGDADFRVVRAPAGLPTG